MKLLLTILILISIGCKSKKQETIVFKKASSLDSAAIFNSKMLAITEARINARQAESEKLNAIIEYERGHITYKEAYKKQVAFTKAYHHWDSLRNDCLRFYRGDSIYKK